MRRLSSEQVWLNFAESRWMWIADPPPQGIPLPRSGNLDCSMEKVKMVMIPTLGRFANSNILDLVASFQTSLWSNTSGVVFKVALLSRAVLEFNMNLWWFWWPIIFVEKVFHSSESTLFQNSSKWTLLVAMIKFTNEIIRCLPLSGTNSLYYSGSLILKTGFSVRKTAVSSN